MDGGHTPLMSETPTDYNRSNSLEDNNDFKKISLGVT